MLLWDSPFAVTLHPWVGKSTNHQLALVLKTTVMQKLLHVVDLD